MAYLQITLDISEQNRCCSGLPEIQSTFPLNH